MSNFIVEYEKGQKGQSIGITLGPGFNNLSRVINGIQQGRYFCIAAPSKTGKSTFLNYSFIIQVYLHSLKHNIEVEWIYYSLEMDRISQEFNFAAFFLHYDSGIETILLEDGVTRGGKSVIELSAAYLRGRLMDDNDKLIKVKPSIFEELKKVYANRIIPLFGEYGINGGLLKKGLITFITNSDNPTGVYKYILKHAGKHGRFVKTGAKDYKRITGYLPNNPKKFTFVILDHIRKVKLERGWQMKQTVDKMSEYLIEIRNLLNYIPIVVVHLNRSLSATERLRQAGDMLYPMSDDIKDSGNISEDADYVITMFNPNDERYGLSKHFGKTIKDNHGNPIYPNLRTIHLVDSRHCDFPQHFSVGMIGSYKTFKQIKLK